jgi:TRAP-type transport system periplasmic protein
MAGPVHTLPTSYGLHSRVKVAANAKMIRSALVNGAPNAECSTNSLKFSAMDFFQNGSGFNSLQLIRNAANRRHQMIKRPTYLAATASLLVALSTSAANAITLTVADGLGPKHVVAANGIAPWMACVKQGTNDAVDFKYFPSGQLATVTNALDSLNKGIADVAFISASNEPDKLPLTGVVMLPNSGQVAVESVAAWRKSLDANGPLTAEFTANKFRPLILNVLPPYQIMTITPIDSVDKLKGLKIRAAGGALSFVVKALGGIPVEMPASDMYLALQRKTVDGTILALSSANSYNLHEVVKGMSSNLSLGTSAQIYGISLAAWNKLTSDQQKVMDQCGRKIEIDLAKLTDDDNEKLKVKFTSLGVNVVQFGPAQKAAIDERLLGVKKEYIDRVQARGLPAQQAYDSYLKFIGK